MSDKNRFWICDNCGEQNPEERLYSCKKCAFPRTAVSSSESVTWVYPPLALHLVAGPDRALGNQWKLDAEYTVIGSRLTGRYESSIDLNELDEQRKISAPHVTIIMKNDAVEIVDQGSTNGTVVNQTRLEKETVYPLRIEDKIRMGSLVFKLIRDR